MATHYKFMTAEYLLCSLLTAISNRQISLISPEAVVVLEFVLFLLPPGCVTTIDHAIVVPPKKSMC